MADPTIIMDGDDLMISDGAGSVRMPLASAWRVLADLSRQALNIQEAADRKRAREAAINAAVQQAEADGWRIVWAPRWPGDAAWPFGIKSDGWVMLLTVDPYGAPLGWRPSTIRPEAVGLTTGVLFRGPTVHRIDVHGGSRCGQGRVDRADRAVEREVTCQACLRMEVSDVD